MSTAQAEHYTDALEMAFDAIKAVERREGPPSAQEHAALLAQLWTGLAIAVEIRQLRTEWAAREAAWNARMAAGGWGGDEEEG